MDSNVLPEFDFFKPDNLTFQKMAKMSGSGPNLPDLGSCTYGSNIIVDTAYSSAPHQQKANGGPHEREESKN